MRSESQKRADAKYREKVKERGSKAQWKTELNIEQAQELNAYIKAQGISKPEFLRRALAALKEQE